MSVGDNRTVARLKPKKAIVLRDAISVSAAAKKMANEKADAILLTDAAGVLTGILTDKDVMGRVVALGLVPENTLVSAVMTRSPSCVSPNDVALDALAKMVEGRFRHLPVIKGSQVVGLLDITKCLKDAITKLEATVSGDKALMSTIQNIERELDNAWHNKEGEDVSHTLLATLRSRIKGRTVGDLLNNVATPEVTLKRFGRCG